jgi:hypothetical protein
MWVAEKWQNYCRSNTLDMPHDQASFKFYVPDSAMINTTNVVFPNAINHPQQHQKWVLGEKIMYTRWYNHNPK